VKLGRDKLILSHIFYKLLILSIFSVFGHFWVKFGEMKKVDGSGFFWSDFDFMGPKSDLLEFIEKQPPHKALCLGPTPPPLSKVEIYRFFTFFIDFRAFNRSGKTVTQIGIYIKPPPKSGPKSEFFRNLSIFYVFYRF
jgi:hypothetical protein